MGIDISLGSCKLKQRWDPTAYVLEWLKPERNLTTLDAGEDESNRNSHCLLPGMKSAAAASGDSLTAPYKAEQTRF